MGASDSVVILHASSMFKSKVTLCKPIYVGQAVLDHSKLEMYNLFYQTLKPYLMFKQVELVGGDITVVSNWSLQWTSSTHSRAFLANSSPSLTVPTIPLTTRCTLWRIRPNWAVSRMNARDNPFKKWCYSVPRCIPST